MSLTGKATDEEEENVLYIAMAGTHQIWVVYLKDGRWFKGGCVPLGRLLSVIV